MRIKVKINNDDPLGLSQNKFLKIFILIIGILTTLLELTGIFIDLFFPDFSYSYHSVAGERNWMRLLIGILALLLFYMLSRKKKNNP